MEHWESISPGGYRFVYDEAVFPPGTDSFLLSALPRLKAGMRVCDLGCCSSASRGWTSRAWNWMNMPRLWPDGQRRKTA